MALSPCTYRTGTWSLQAWSRPSANPKGSQPCSSRMIRPTISSRITEPTPKSSHLHATLVISATCHRGQAGASLSLGPALPYGPTTTLTYYTRSFGKSSEADRRYARIPSVWAADRGNWGSRFEYSTTQISETGLGGWRRRANRTTLWLEFPANRLNLPAAQFRCQPV